MPQRSIKSTNLRQVLFALLLLLCAESSAITLQHSSEWQTIVVNDWFTFRLPPGFIKRETKREDERGEFYHGETKVVFIWGHTESSAYSSRRQLWMNNYHESVVRLSGKRANNRTYSRTTGGKRTFHAELNVGNWEKGEVELYLAVEGTDPATLDLANQVFKSVTFPLPPPERPNVR
jgi:hypothetical protein